MSLEYEGLIVVSDETAQKNYEASIADTIGFIRKTYRRLRFSNPNLEELFSTHATMVSVAYGTMEAIYFLRGASFVDSCFDLEAQRGGSPYRRLTQSALSQTGQSFPMAEDQILKDMSSANPNLYLYFNRFREITKLFNSPIATQMFCDGVETCYLAHALQASIPDELESEESEAVEIPPGHLPAVRREIIGDALLEIVLDRKDFISSTLTRLSTSNSAMVDRLIRSAASESDLTLEEDFLIMTSLVGYCLMEEFDKRGLPFPQVSEATFKIVAGDMMEMTDKGQHLDRDQEMWEQMERYNPHLYKAYWLQMKPRMTVDMHRAIAAKSGGMFIYRELHYQQLSDYLSRQFTI